MISAISFILRNLSLERVLDIYDYEKPLGVILSMGGQIPNNLAMKLHRAKVRVLGTSPLSIDKCEDRNKFSSILDKLKIEQPLWQELSSVEKAKSFASEIGYPVSASSFLCSFRHCHESML